MRPARFGIDAEVTDLLVGWRVTTVARYRLDDVVEGVERGTPAVTLGSHPETEVTSRPLPVRVLQQSDFPLGCVHIARVGSCHVWR